MVVMPNHFHCIIENMEPDGHDAGMDGHDPGMADNPGMDPGMDAHEGAPLRGRPNAPGRPMSPGHPNAPPPSSPIRPP